MSAPILFVFHGALDTTEQAAEYTRLDRLASSQGVYVVYPQGRFLNWPPSIPPENPECIEPDLALFDALCRELAHRYPVDTKRIYVTGMSQGAAFVNLLVAKRSEKIAAAAAHSGWLPDPLGESPLHTRRKCPMLFIAGTEDRQVPPAAVREAYDCFRRADHPVEFLLIEGLGHHWALEHDVNAKIWRFLSPHRLGRVSVIIDGTAGPFVTPRSPLAATRGTGVAVRQPTPLAPAAGQKQGASI